jgi:multidrug efflux pump subunit AcrB
MKFTDLFIRRPVLAIVVNVLIVIAGAQAVRSLNVRQYPRSENAAITVTTTYVGATADLVRGFITTPLERSIAAADGIDYIESESHQNVSIIRARLRLNHDATKALSEISAKVNQVRGDLPPSAEIPVINIESADSQFASAYLSFSSEFLKQNEITDYLVRVVQPRLSAIEGVQRADLLGARTFAMRIWLKPDRMAALNVSPAGLRQALSANNYLAAVGQTKGNLVQVNLTANTDLRSAKEFEEMVVRQGINGGGPVRLKDVADVVLGAEDYDTQVNFDGQTAVFIGIWTLPSANALDVIKKVRVEMESLQKELPEQIKGVIAYDATKYISSAISEVVSTLLETLLIVVIVIFLFLGSLRSSLVPVIAIPVSLIGGIFLIQAFGFTINLLTLLAIVLSVGLVVDDAIVVVENVERHLAEGLKPMEAALQGARELVGPIISMTITLAAVYAPIAFQGGLTGSLFREFALTLAGAVTISGIVALTLSPVMSAYLLKPASEEKGLARFINRTFDRVRASYGRGLDRLLQTRGPIYAAWVVVSILAFLMFSQSPKELAPAEDQGVVLGIVNTPANSTLEQVTQSTRAIQAAVAPIPETQFVFQITNPSGGFWGDGLKPWDERKRTAGQVLREISGKVAAIPGVQTFAIVPPALPGGGNFPVEVVIASTADTSEILQFATRLQQKAATSGIFAFPPIIDTKIDQPQTEISINRDKVAGPGRGGGRQLRQPLQRRGPQLQGHPAAPARRPAQPRAAAGHPGDRPQRPAGGALHGGDAEGLGDAAHAQPLPAAQRGQAQRRRHPAARRGAALPRDRGRPDAAQGLRPRLHRRVAPAADRGRQVPARVPARHRAHLPGAGGAVQQLPRPVRHPRRLGAARHVRRAGADVPQDAQPQHALLHRRLDDDAQRLFAGGAGDAGGAGRQERHPHRRVREPAAGEGAHQARGHPRRGRHPAAAGAHDQRGHRLRTLPADAGDRTGRGRAQQHRPRAGGGHGGGHGLHALLPAGDLHVAGEGPPGARDHAGGGRGASAHRAGAVGPRLQDALEECTLH